jgi:SAM-dependent methyltransferase
VGDTSAEFIGSIPELYDRGLGPVIFVDYAAELTGRVVAAKPARVLELAAGTGILTRMLRDRLPAAADLVATDLNQDMLDIARQKFTARERIAFQAADAQALQFGDGAFDAIACQFGVMFFPDKDKSYREAYRVLRRGGRYHFNVWGSRAANPFAQIAHQTIAGFFKDNPPGFYDVPFGYHDSAQITASLSAAGFAEVAARVLPMDKTIASARQFAVGLVVGNPVIHEIRARGTADVAAVVAAVTAALNRAFGPDPGHMPLQAIAFSAAKP